MCIRDRINGYDLESKVEKLLPNIGFNQNEADRLVGDFSGGWQMRIALGKILLQSPDLLLLDEPTNHLDLETIEWLENYLLNQKIAMVIVSHDRSFLDKVCTRIVNTERGQSKSYLGNYTSYLQQRDFELESTKVAYEKQQKDMQVQKAYIERFRASATRSTQAKSREKLLDKVEKIEAPENSLKGPNFIFLDSPRAGRDILSIKDLTHSYEDNILFLGAFLELEPGERIAFLGPNGSGKSTLLQIMAGLNRPTSGAMLWNSKIINNVLTTHSARVNYVGHLASVKLALTVEEDIKFWMQLNNHSDQEIMEIALEHFGLLHQRSMPVRFLSSGQQRKLALTRLMVRDSKIWLLDEPTVGLDSKSIQSLEDIIQKQRADSGIVVVASHTEISLGNSIKNINLSNFQTNNTQAYSPGFGYEE